MVYISEIKMLVTEMNKDDLIHYTSVDALYSILENQKIWLTKSDFLNDPSEFKHFDKILKVFLDEFKNKSNFNDLAFSSEVERALYEDNCYEHFIFSLSYDPDSLSLWNYYGKKDGYNLIFKRSLWRNFCNFLSTLNNDNEKEKAKLYSGEVLYDEKKKHNFLEKRLNKLYEDWNDLDHHNSSHISEFQLEVELFLKGLRMYFKNEAYKQEKEIRYVLSIPKHITNKILKFRTLEGSLIPYIEVPLPIDFIEDITIGPKISIDIAKQGLNRFLEYKNLDIDLKKSNIPIRY